MWKIKLDNNTWLADGAGDPPTTSIEAEAATFPDMPAAQQALKKARRTLPYLGAIFYAAFEVDK